MAKYIKSVGFNDDNPEEAKMLKLFKRKRNFSKYIKGLIADDLAAMEAERKKVKEKPPEPVEYTPQTEPVIQKTHDPVSHSPNPSPQYPNSPTGPLLFPNQKA